MYSEKLLGEHGLDLLVAEADLVDGFSLAGVEVAFDIGRKEDF